MITYYPVIKQLHVAVALSSGALFGLRGIALLCGARWPRWALVRYLSYSIDTALLTAAMLLLTILPAALFANGWLWVKVGFVASYVVLGVLAFADGRRVGARALLLLLAALCFAQVYGIARSHHPLGWLVWLG